METRHTLVIGASENPERYAHKAIRMLRSFGHPVTAVGLRAGQVGDVPILTGQPAIKDIHTITLYVGPDRQAPLLPWLLELSPKRVIFIPGTENPVLEKQLQAHGIATEEACTLVLLQVDAYA